MSSPAHEQAVTLRLAGDSGDGMQLAGTLFTLTSARCGNHVRTLPEFPAEIRAPAGTLTGVSAFQVRFSGEAIFTPGDRLDALVAMNPAALKAHVKDLRPGGLLLVNRDVFTPDELHRAHYPANPLEDGSLAGYRVLAVPMTMRTRAAVVDADGDEGEPFVSDHETERCKNFFALGLVYWLFDRPLAPTLRWIHEKLDNNPPVREASARTLQAGYHYAQTAKGWPSPVRVAAGSHEPGRYRHLTGTEATALGLVAAAAAASRPLVFAGYPMTPSTDLLHQLVNLGRHGIRAVQAEDEPAAAAEALGASFAGAIGVTATSGPGLARVADVLGLAVAAELPLVVIDVQRGGPGTGLPTKTEQADLLQALFGRNGESPAFVLAPRSPADCFDTMLEAVRLAVGRMSPVVVLADAHLAYGGETWRVRTTADLPDLRVAEPAVNGPRFLPYRRDERGVRPWAVPGTPGLEHRLTGHEKEHQTGSVSYDALNHERMVQARAAKVADADIPDLVVDGPETADVLVVGWGSTYGVIAAAARRCRRRGLAVAHAQLRHLHPLPRNTGDVMRRYPRVLVPELNTGQLRMLLRATFLIDAAGMAKVQGRPFLVNEVEEQIMTVGGVLLPHPSTDGRERGPQD